MSTPTPSSTPVANPSTTQTPVVSGNSAADASAAAAKKSLEKETSSTSILTSGAGVLDDVNTKKNLLG